MFRGSFGQILNKWTLGSPVSFVGNLVAHGYNLAGKIDNVTYLEGMLALSGPTGDTFEAGHSNELAFTIGHYSFGPKGYKADWRDHLFVHEYGHYIQSQWLSALYFPIIAIPSLCSAARICKVDHDRRWFEVNASKLGSRYFDKRYGSGAPGYKKGDSNYFDLDSFKDERKKSPYENPRFNIVNTQKPYPISGEIYTIWDFLIL